MTRHLLRLLQLLIILLVIPGDMFGGALPYAESSIDYEVFRREAPRQSLEQLVRHAWEAIQEERYDAAAAYYSVAASRYDPSLSKRDIRRCALASVNMGYIWLAWRMNAAEAYPWLMKAKQIATTHGLRDVESAVISNLGQIYFDYNNIPKANALVREAFERVMADHDDHYYGRALIDYATVALHDGGRTIPDSLVTCMSGYQLPADAPLAEYAPCMAEALRLLRSGSPLEGARILQNATPLLRLDSDSQRYSVQHYLCVGLLWMAGSDFKRAATALAEGVAIAREMEYFNLVEKGYGYLEECTRHTGSPSEVERYHREVLQIRDSLFNASRFEAVKDLQIADRLASLNRSVREATARAESQRRRIWISSGVALLFAVVIIWIYVKHRRLREAYREIYKRNMELSERPLLVIDSHDAAPTPLPGGEVSSDSGESPLESAAPSEDEEDAAARRQLMHRVRTLMEEKREIFDPDFSIERMARLLDTREKILSQTINRATGKNFSTLLCEYRIREACRLLADPEVMLHTTMEGVAERVGYRSRTYFSTVFKSVIGLTPSQFVRQAREAARHSERK
ncbi:MAG: AraC family transcriptional regulator [Muribaculaceae bacterium]|nr:AraC family transcriptional regulator [Muribaculaceae bacterium]